jgi:hypothetical protein
LIACGDKPDLSGVSKRQSRIEEFPIIGLQETPARIPMRRLWPASLHALGAGLADAFLTAEKPEPSGIYAPVFGVGGLSMGYGFPSQMVEVRSSVRR